jgi:hypothetical protein
MVVFLANSLGFPFFPFLLFSPSLLGFFFVPSPSLPWPISLWFGVHVT